VTKPRGIMELEQHRKMVNEQSWWLVRGWWFLASNLGHDAKYESLHVEKKHFAMEGVLVCSRWFSSRKPMDASLAQWSGSHTRLKTIRRVETRRRQERQRLVRIESSRTNTSWQVGRIRRS